MKKQEYLWLDHYPENVAWDLKIEERSVFSMLQDTAGKYPENPAFDFLGKRYKWGEIHDLARKMAKGLQSHGVGKGDKIGLFLPNCPYYVVAYFAILMTGATVVNLNPLYAEGELSHLIEDSETDMVVTLDLKMLYDKMDKMLQATRLRRIIVCKFTH